MQAASADSRVRGPGPGSPGGGGPADVGALEKLAQSMAENIVQSFLGQTETGEPEVSGSNRSQETFAEELASAVVEVALREVCGGAGVVEGSQSSRPAGAETDDDEDAGNLDLAGASGRDRDFLNKDSGMDPVTGLQASQRTQPHHPPLSQAGLPLVGSLDYPDAPPTTPLLPELERSRHSFARKLKGGLAKAFLPSPPPPTPKDDEGGPGPAGGPRAELLEHLVHSLSAHDQRGAKVEAFAGALSRDIVGWALSAKSREQVAGDRDLRLLAHQLAETIIASSLNEAKTPV